MIQNLLDWFSRVGPHQVPSGAYPNMKKHAAILKPRLEKLKKARLKQEKIDAEIALKEKVEELKRKAAARELARKKAKAKKAIA